MRCLVGRSLKNEGFLDSQKAVSKLLLRETQEGGVSENGRILRAAQGNKGFMQPGFFPCDFNPPRIFSFRFCYLFTGPNAHKYRQVQQFDAAAAEQSPRAGGEEALRDN